MKTIKRIIMIFACMITLSSVNAQYLHLYKDGSLIKSYVTESIDSMLFDTSGSTYYMDLYNNGTKHRVDNLGRIDNFKLGGVPIKSGIYMGVMGFNSELYTKSIGSLSSTTKSSYTSYVNNLTSSKGTLLYYGVENALDALKNADVPEDLLNVTLVTFTDGLDEGSFMMQSKYANPDTYLTALNNIIKNDKIQNVSINAYSIGLRGNDVTDVAQFQKNLQYLASSEENAVEVSDISEVNAKFQEIANDVYNESLSNTVSLTIPGQSDGTKIRFTFDNVSSATNSTMYIEGTFRLSDRALVDVTYHGLSCGSGDVVVGEQDGIFVTFTFEEVKSLTSRTISASYIDQWKYITTSGNWQINSEFTPESDTKMEVIRKSALIMLVLDCSSSLGSQFSTVKTQANNFIGTLAGYGNDEEFSPIDLRGNTPPENPNEPTDTTDIPTNLITDGHIYQTDNVTGITCKSKWVIDRIHTPEQFMDLQFVKDYASKARTAAIDVKKRRAYIGYSKTAVVDSTSNDYAHLVIFNLETGEYIKELPLTYNGTAISGLLCANQVGIDDAGNVWICGMYSDVNANPAKIYVVENFETGACKLVGEWKLPDEETDAAGRIDYWDVVGDITGETSNAVCMGAVGNTAAGEKLCLYRWELAQGATEWVANEDDFAGYVSNTDLAETYPADQVTWGASATTVRIVAEEGYVGSMFYVDGFTTCPSLYQTSLTMVESFASATDLAPTVGCNGIDEFTINGKHYIAYAEAQYNMSPGCRVNICELGEGATFEGMRLLWSVPEAGLGETSDGGTRIHNIDTYKVIDENGKEGVYLLTYKCNNGIGLYLIAEEGFNESTAH